MKEKPLRFIQGHQRRKTTPAYIEDGSGCWIWQRCLTKNGYGLMRDGSGGHMKLAHRVYYERVKGPLPKGKQLDHTCHSNDPDCPGGICRHRRCVNPAHLEPVTNRQNAERGKIGGRANPKPRAKPTHCKHGHAYTAENTLVGSDDAWRCRECQKASMRRYYRRRKAAEAKSPDRP